MMKKSQNFTNPVSYEDLIHHATPTTNSPHSERTVAVVCRHCSCGLPGYSLRLASHQYGIAIATLRYCHLGVPLSRAAWINTLEYSKLLSKCREKATIKWWNWWQGPPLSSEVWWFALPPLSLCQEPLDWHSHHWDAAVGQHLWVSVPSGAWAKAAAPWALLLTQAWQFKAILFWCIALSKLNTWWQRRPRSLVLWMNLTMAVLPRRRFFCH